MADVKISDLPAAAALTDADVAPLVQGGATRRGTVAQFNDNTRKLRGQYSSEAAGRVIADADHGRTIIYTGSAAATFVLPAGAPVGTLVVLVQDGTGKASFAAGGGTTATNLRASGQMSTATQGATIVAEMWPTGAWRVSGDAGV